MKEDKKDKKPKKAAAKKPKAAKKKTAKPKKEEAKPETKEAKKEPAAKAEPPEPETKPLEKKPGKKKQSRAKKKVKKVFVARGKRKESVARTTIQAGKGVIRINSQSLSSFGNRYVREIIGEPLRYMGPEATTVDLSVNVNGGGVMGQAQAARTSIAKALVLYFEDLNLKEKFNSIDRSLIIEDTRRVERKKYCGPKARARYQKSYR